MSLFKRQPVAKMPSPSFEAEFYQRLTDMRSVTRAFEQSVDELLSAIRQSRPEPFKQLRLVQGGGQEQRANSHR